MSRLTLATTSAAALLGAIQPEAAEVTLTVHHFLGPSSPAHVAFMAPWSERVKQQSGGRIEVQIFPSMSMGGSPPELYRQVRDGFADIVWTLPGYTPGVFPRVEVFELPTVHLGSALATNLAIQDVWDRVKDDFKDVHPLLVHVHAGNALHVKGKTIATVADVKGLKLRTPTRTAAWMIAAWGAEPVGMPVPALPQALSKGTVDGALVPFEVVPALKLHELTDVSVEGADGSRFGASVFLFAMNKGRYEGLPPELKAVIDANANAALARQAGKIWDEVETPGRALQRGSGSGNRIVALDPAAKAGFDQSATKAVDRWIGEADAAGLDGRGLVEAARRAIAAQSANP